MKTAWFIVVILLLLSLVGNWIQWDISRDKDLISDLKETQSVLRIQEADARTTRRDSAIALLQTKMDSASQYHAKEQERHHGAINALKRRERLNRHDTTVLTLTDTIYLAYDSLVESLTTERNGIKADCKALTDSLLANIDDLKGIRVELEGQVQRRNEALTKEKKKGKWYKRGLVAAGAVILYLSIKPD